MKNDLHCSLNLHVAAAPLFALILSLCVAQPLFAQHTWLKGSIGFDRGPQIGVDDGPYQIDATYINLQSEQNGRSGWLGLSFERPSGRIWDFSLRANGNRNLAVSVPLDTANEMYVDRSVGKFDRQLVEVLTECSYPLRAALPDRLARPYLGWFASAYYSKGSFSPLPDFGFYPRELTHTGINAGLVPRFLVRTSKTSTRLVVDFSAMIGLLSLRHENSYTDNPNLSEPQKRSTSFDTALFRRFAFRIGLAYRLTPDRE